MPVLPTLAVREKTRINTKHFAVHFVGRQGAIDKRFNFFVMVKFMVPWFIISPTGELFSKKINILTTVFFL